MTELERTRRVWSRSWSHLHRDGESYWWLAPMLIGWLGLLSATAGLIAHEVVVDWQPLIVVGAFAHQLMWGILLAVVAFGMARRWWALFAALVVFSGVAATQAALYIPGATHVADGPRLTMLQANLRVGSADPQRFVALVRSENVDVATTEELTIREQTRLIDAGLSQLLPYHYTAPARDGADGLGIWSRYPLSETVTYPGFTLGVVSATIALPGQAVTLFAVHLLPPYPYPSRTWVHEVASMKGLLDTADLSGRPVLVGGDFNSTIDNAQFRHLLVGGYGDAAEEVGAGYLATYPANQWFPPLIAIDHVLTANVPAVGLASVEVPGSDHRGLVARLAI